MFARTLLLWCAAVATGAAPGAQSVEALRRAAALVQEGRLQEADEQARLALADPETRAVACSVLGAIRLRQERLAEAAQLLQEAIRLEPRLVGAHLTLAEVYTQQGRPQRALEMFRRALDLDPQNATARLALARAEAEKGNYARSLELAEPVLAAFEDSPDGLFVLATAYLKTGDRAAASRLAAHWTSLRDDVPHVASVKFAELLAGGGLTKEALDVLEQAQKAGPVSYELALALGGAYLVSGDPARALEAYDLALGRKPDSVLALRQAARVAERRGELERSLSYWLRARKIASDDPEILLGFGRVCLKMDLLDDAEPALLRAASQRPGEPAFQYPWPPSRSGRSSTQRPRR